MNKRRLLQITAFISATFVISACAGVPFSTLWHYRNFGPEDLLRTDPADLRAAIQLDDGVNLGSKPPELDVRLQLKNQSEQKFLLPLEVLKQGPWVGVGTTGAVKGRHWYLLGFSAEGIKTYRQLQQVLAGNLNASGHFKEPARFMITVRTNSLKFSKAGRKRLGKTDRLFLQTRLELFPREGFRTLYKGEIKMSARMAQKLAAGG